MQIWVTKYRYQVLRVPGNGTVSTGSYNAQGSLASLTHDLAGTGNDLGFDYVHNQSDEIITTNPINP